MSEAQYMAALANANDVRLRRADLRRRAKSGEVDVRALLTDEAMARMPVASVLAFRPRWGRARVRVLLREAGVSEQALCGALTQRQIGALSGRSTSSAEQRRQDYQRLIGRVCRAMAREGGGPLTASEVSSAAGVDVSGVWMTKLVHDGLMERAGRRRRGEYRVQTWTLTDAGWDRAEDSYRSAGQSPSTAQEGTT